MSKRRASGEGNIRKRADGCWEGRYVQLMYNRVREHGRVNHVETKGKSLSASYIHSLRHPFATLALQNGVDIRTVSGMLGHSDPGFTLRTYTHATHQMQEKAAIAVGDALVRHL